MSSGRTQAFCRDDPNRWLLSCTVLTTTAHDSLGHVHDRAPVIIPPSRPHNGWTRKRSAEDPRRGPVTSVVDEDADELPHDRFGVFLEPGEPAADQFQGRQRELRQDRRFRRTLYTGCPTRRPARTSAGSQCRGRQARLSRRGGRRGVASRVGTGLKFVAV
ncbi:SOS response-associated peptidase family protein [Arthrobacter sp. TB 26]|uniref:SOS response-associated peptidase family protein n=1 Tax=Arthrobacter sp. TB 26 TaxID=494420 RepID=UPI001ED9B17A|nr:SOS response-associated peptidase family protein [Arthrobacter sp. TB 26]